MEVMLDDYLDMSLMEHLMSHSVKWCSLKS
jgi:hypothetical protein